MTPRLLLCSERASPDEALSYLELTGERALARVASGELWSSSMDDAQPPAAKAAPPEM